MARISRIVMIRTKFALLGVLAITATWNVMKQAYPAFSVQVGETAANGIVPTDRDEDKKGTEKKSVALYSSSLDTDKSTAEYILTKTPPPSAQTESAGAAADAGTSPPPSASEFLVSMRKSGSQPSVSVVATPRPFLSIDSYSLLPTVPKEEYRQEMDSAQKQQLSAPEQQQQSDPAELTAGWQQQQQTPPPQQQQQPRAGPVSFQKDDVKSKKSKAAEAEAALKSKSRRTVTETGIDLTDQALFETVDLEGDSTTASVISLGVGYDLPVFHRFVGSLRKSGFKGHILLVVEASIDPEIIRYMEFRNVTYKLVEMIDHTHCVNLTRSMFISENFAKEQCPKQYPDVLARWARHQLMHDLLSECEGCTGPVLHVDIRDVFFQLDPFGPGSPPVRGLELFQEHKENTCKNWYNAKPLMMCKNTTIDGVNLCAGSTVGNRAAVLKYFEVIYAELKVWLHTPNCTFSDQPIHNYLYYSGQLPFARDWPNREGGIVNTAFNFDGFKIVDAHVKKMKALYHIPDKEPHGKLMRKALYHPYEGAEGMRWIGKQFNLVDDEGFFTEFDGTRSRVAHKYDRFGGFKGDYYHDHWLMKQDWLEDSVPNDYALFSH